jgi:hypothetical protein
MFLRVWAESSAKMLKQIRSNVAERFFMGFILGESREEKGKRGKWKV